MSGIIPLVPWYHFKIEWYVPWMTGTIPLVPWYCCKLMVCTMVCWYCVQFNGTYHGIHYDTTVTDLAGSMEINAMYLAYINLTSKWQLNVYCLNIILRYQTLNKLRPPRSYEAVNVPQW
jgi:hypothetical protein